LRFSKPVIKGEEVMTTTIEHSIETNEAASDNVSSSSTENQLLEGVTEEPRNKEEMDLKHIRKWPNAVQVYLKVSDDAGEVLGNKSLEQQVKQFCDQYANPKTEIKDLVQVLGEAKELATIYTLQISMVESGLSGTITKYRILQGMIFNIMKKLVKESKGPKWIEWFKANFDGREFRSVQDYMRLAKIPGVICYAVFGKERLLEIDRQLTDDDWKERLNDAGEKEIDPVGAFIARNGINFNPEEELDAQELRIETDIAINYQKLLNAGINDIPKDMIDALVRNGKEIESVHVTELKVTRDAEQDVVKRFEELVASDARVTPNMTPARKAQGFKNTADKFIKAVENALGDIDYRGQINADLIASLKDSLRRLEEALN